jgi:hypothetical protein
LACAWQRFSTFLVTVCEYTDTIWGPLGEFPFFAEIPRWTTFAGMVRIMAAGIYALRPASGTKPPEPVASEA